MHRITLGVLVALGLACAGPKGEPGADGPTGPQGPAGPAGTFTGTYTGDATVSGNMNVQGQLRLALGDGPTTPATSCAALLSARPGIASGVYWLKPSSAADAFRAYCDMVNEGGGWTLVWSNLRGTRAKPFTEIQWKAAVNTLPRVSGAMSADLESFVVYTGLKHWTPLAPGGLLRYDWATDYGAAIQQRYECPFIFSNLATYQITFNTSGCTQPIGTVVPGLVFYSNNGGFSTYDVDNDTDTSATPCGTIYTNSPWWFKNCWDGSIVGGGELTGSGYFNGAFWRGSQAGAWGGAGGAGAGNGWIFVK